jgi:24-methylenesterol C-methyltransferase
VLCGYLHERQHITLRPQPLNCAHAHNRKASVDCRYEVVCGNFLVVPFPHESFNDAYTIEATCHAPRLQDIYGEVFCGA